MSPATRGVIAEQGSVVICLVVLFWRVAKHGAPNSFEALASTICQTAFDSCMTCNPHVSDKLPRVHRQSPASLGMTPALEALQPVFKLSSGKRAADRSRCSIEKNLMQHRVARQHCSNLQRHDITRKGGMCGTTGDFSDSENGWEWLSALAKHNAKPLQPPPAAASHAFNPLFSGDLMQAASASQPIRQRSQSLNPMFKAKRAEHAELDLDSSSWQLQGLVADARSSPDEVPNLAWHRSTSSGSNLFGAEEFQPHTQLISDSRARSSSSNSSQSDAHSTAQLLTDDRPGSGDWMSSSSSSDDNLAPLRSMSLPEAAVTGLVQREFGASTAPRRDASLPLGFQSSLPAVLERQTTPVLTLRQRYGSRQELREVEEGNDLEGSVLEEGRLQLSDESSSDDSDLQAGLEDIQLQMASSEEDEGALPQQVNIWTHLICHRTDR